MAVTKKANLCSALLTDLMMICWLGWLSQESRVSSAGVHCEVATSALLVLAKVSQNLIWWYLEISRLAGASWCRQGYDLKEERPQKLAALRPLAYDDIGMCTPWHAWPMGLASSSILDTACVFGLNLFGVMLHRICIASKAACNILSCRRPGWCLTPVCFSIFMITT